MADSMSEDSSSSENESSTPEEEEPEKVDPLKLHPPSFSLPDDDFELWTIRLPRSVDPSLLDGMKLSTGERQTATLKAGETTYGITFGNAVESESFRVLVENEEGFMIPTKKSFVKSVNIVNEETLKDIVEAELAPGIDQAPTPVDNVRHAYSTVPQRSGLKRRWMPLGIPLPTSEPHKDAEITEKRKKVKTEPREEKPVKVEKKDQTEMTKEMKKVKKDKKKSKKKKKKAVVKEE